jgi:nucleoid-associated protein YgaU
MLHPSTDDFNQLLTAGACWILLGCGGWTVAICAAAALESATRGRVRATRWVGCPAPLRRALLAALGLALTGATTLPPGGAAVSRSTDGRGVARATRQLPVPARPIGPRPLHTMRVVVRPGDTLWHLTERRLPASATPAAVAEGVSRMHELNRTVIGADPDLIRPGQSLVLPALPRAQNPSPTEPTPRGEP